MKFHCISVFILFKLLSLLGDAVADNHENCEFWASMGECEKNPSYMLENCADACSKATTVDAVQAASSLYEIDETDIDGQTVPMESFRGKVLYIVNVASHCGYTEENYSTFRRLKDYRSQDFEMILAPCNQVSEAWRVLEKIRCESW
jgi:Glutathione peroxidase/ShK domain-like